MEIARATAHLPVASLEVVEATFAERVTPTAVFCAWHQIQSSAPLEVGVRVELEVGTARGVVAFVCRGVVAWAWAEGATPAGREGGVGILVGEVVDGGERFSRMLARPGAGARVAVPGARVLSRARLAAPPIVLCAPRAADDAGPVAPPRQARDDTVVASIDDLVTPIPAAEAGEPSSRSSRETFAALLASALGSDSDEDPITGGGDAVVDVQAPVTTVTVDERAAAGPATDDGPGADPFARVDDLDVGTDSDPSRAPTVAYDVDQLLPPTAEASDRLRVLAAALQQHELDETAAAIDGPTLDGMSDEDPDPGVRVPPLLTADLDLSAIDDLPVPPAPMGEAVMLDLSDVDAFPEAPPEPVGRPFEAQSTDIDLLTSISGADVVAVTTHASDDDSAEASGEATLRRLPRRSSADIEPEADDLPSIDADLLEEAWPEAEAQADWRNVETERFHNRRLPAPEGWPDWSDLLDARTLGVSFSVSRRGVGGLEFFAWPVAGTKRYSGVGQGEAADPRRSRTAILPMADLDDIGDPLVADDDGDVFSAPSLPPVGDDDEDPFASSGTDPRLNVEGLVALHVRASHQDVDTAVFGAPELESSGAFSVEPDVDFEGLGAFVGLERDVTRDELLLPRPRSVVATKALADPLSGTDSGEGEPSDSDERV
jgi:hypothetical protein